MGEHSESSLRGHGDQGHRSLARAWPPILLAMIASAGCASAWTPRPLPDMAGVRAELGLPQAMRYLPNGDETWEYTRNVRQRGAWRYVFEPSGRVRTAQPMRTRGDLEAIVVAQTRGAGVVSLLGSPDRIVAEGDSVAWQFGLPERGTLVLRFAADRTVASKTVLP
ncbi:MAG: hypothetical protein WCJ69_14290 [Betaproteobacteria bacterium]|jgi:hypothetical protein